MWEVAEMKKVNIPTKAEMDEVLRLRHSDRIQDKLSRAQVAVAGLGGLGSNVAVSLARIGVGHLHLIDFDRVDLSNLNRQQYGIRHLGLNKTEALKQVIEEINPYLDIKTDCIRVEESNVKQLFCQDRIICEAFDVPENKAMLVNGVLEHFPEKLLVAASGMAGFGESNRIRTRQVMQHFYLCGDETTGAGDGIGLMAPRVALCAAHQANLITRLILESDCDL